MKILQVSTHINIGGIGNYILELSKALTKMGVEVTVISSGGSLKDEFRVSSIDCIDMDINTKFEFAPKVISAGFSIGRLVKEKGFDAVHAHSRVSQMAGLIASRIANRPMVTTCHGYFRRRLRGLVDTWGDKVIAISEPVKRHLVEDMRVLDSRIAVVHNGVDVGHFSRPLPQDEVNRLKKELGLGEGFIIGTVGRLSPVKGQRFLIEAMKGILTHSPKTKCVIVGSGGGLDELKAAARSSGAEAAVKFFSADADTRKYYSLMDLFVFPSVNEGLGLALLEAQASGRPCVSSRVGGISDIIEDGVNGLLVTPCQPKAISDAVIKLIEDPVLRGKLAEEGRRVVESRFSIDDMRDKTIALYNELISNREGQPG